MASLCSTIAVILSFSRIMRPIPVGSSKFTVSSAKSQLSFAAFNALSVSSRISGASPTSTSTSSSSLMWGAAC